MARFEKEVKVSKSYSVKVVGELAPYSHFCTAVQFFNFSFSILKDGRFGYQVIPTGSAPEWVKNAMVNETVRTLKEQLELQSYGTRKFLISSVVTEGSGMYGGNRAESNSFVFNTLARKSVVLEEVSRKVLSEFFIYKEDLDNFVQLPVEIPKDQKLPTKKKRSTNTGITEEALVNYLQGLQS